MAINETEAMTSMPSCRRRSWRSPSSSFVRSKTAAGRLHRYIIHHVLAERGDTPTRMMCPASSALVKRQAEYGEEVRTFTGPLLPFFEWVPTEKQRGRMLNETGDLDRFGDDSELTSPSAA